MFIEIAINFNFDPEGVAYLYINGTNPIEIIKLNLSCPEHFHYKNVIPSGFRKNEFEGFKYLQNFE
jgi:hypothetical protein